MTPSLRKPQGEQMTDGLQYVYIKDIKPAQKNLNVIFIILEIGAPTRTKDNHTVRSCKVADKTGSINISIWDDIGEMILTGDICRLVKGYTNIFKNCLTLYAGKNGGINKIGEFCMQFSEMPNMSEPNPEYAQQQAAAKEQQQQQANQRKSPTELDSNQAQSTMAGLNNPGGRGSPPVRNSTPQGQRQMGNGQNFNSNRQQRPQGQTGQGQRPNYGQNSNRGQQQFQGTAGVAARNPNQGQGQNRGQQPGQVQGQNQQNRTRR
ncbi:SOSS complex subunit B1-A-like isoform X2 [Ruditapes philippinarum]|uniref:SOSS complex subunit B1-A-like isoform X2 n=1 Tax=Ruditapes philippinarum TaxID=129788 RepID=UPI00295A6C12|nr:SOSS complex subunit B1-A-like isoform X2 [Ruditapes philippinarum]